MAKSKRKRAAPPWSVELEHGEIVQRGRPIHVAANVAVADEAWGSVTVAGQRALVKPQRNRRGANIDTSSLPPGPHEVIVDDLRGQRAPRRVAATTRIRFFVIESSSPLPRQYVVRHALRLRFEDLKVVRSAFVGSCDRGEIETFKLEHRKTRRPLERAFDSRGRAVELEAELRALERRRQARFGKIHPTLHAQLERTRAGKRLPVAIWLRGAAEVKVDKPNKGYLRRRPPEEVRARDVARAAADRFAEQHARRFGLKVTRVDSLGIVFGVVGADRIRALAAHRSVSGVFLHQTAGINDLADSIAIANSDDAHNAGFTGRGINVAVYEDGPDVTTDLSITARYTTSPATSDHSRHTHGIIKNVEPSRPHGHAPDCNLHSANSKDLAAARWAAEDRGCTVISQSFHRDAEQTSSDLSFDDIYKDHLALRWPYPTICEAAGNGASTEFVNHKGYNRLTVGNHNDAASAMSSDSVFRNPTSSHGDRELPEIAANGTSVTAVKLTKSGTSMAAPACAGAVALIQQASATLRSWPEGCRAIMMAAAWRNPAGSTWHDDLVSGVDGADGAGAIDSKAAIDVARARRSRGNAPSARGWDVGTLRSADIGADRFATFVYRIGVPTRVFHPRVKVALAWDSQVVEWSFLGLSLPIASRLNVDLDLHVRDSAGRTVAASVSYDNSYEIVDFDAQGGETYEIRIRRWSGSHDVWYGVAWQLRGLNIGAISSVVTLLGAR